MRFSGRWACALVSRLTANWMEVRRRSNASNLLASFVIACAALRAVNGLCKIRRPIGNGFGTGEGKHG